MDDLVGPSIPESPLLPLQPFFPEEEDQMPELELEVKVAEPEPMPELEMKVEAEPELAAEEPPQERVIRRRFRERRSKRIRTLRFLSAWRAAKKSKQ